MKAIIKVSDKVLPSLSSESKDKGKKHKKKSKEVLYDEKNLV